MLACNGLPNLQLLQATQNIEKSDKPFAQWLSLSYPSQNDRESFLMQNYIDTSESLDFKNFLSFISSRRAALRNKFKNMLQVHSIPAA